MCNDMWKEFRGWCKSFTRTEALLAILEAVLLAACVGFAIFLTLHFIACEKRHREELTEHVEYSTTEHVEYSTTEHVEYSTTDILDRYSTTEHVEYSTTDVLDRYSTTNTPVGYSATNTTTTTSPTQTTTETDGNETFTRITATETTQRTTLPPHVKCTWEPSHKTGAGTLYYEDEAGDRTTEPGTTKNDDELTDHDSVGDLATGDQEEGEESDDVYKSMIMALVKMVPPAGVTFGCTLTVISDRWALTAASCVEAAEEVDSLDSFVIMEDYGGGAKSRSHVLADVRLHPRFEGARREADLAALQSEDRLFATPAQLPAPLDRWLLALGERFTVLGFGSYRTIEKSTYGRSVREARVYSVAARQCGAGAGLASRHLSGGRAVAERPPPPSRALCFGVLAGRGAPCTYCAGTPLLRQATLLAVMASAECAVACEPKLYADVAAARPWLDSFLDS